MIRPMIGFALFLVVVCLPARAKGPAKVCSQTESNLAMSIVPTAALDPAWPAPLYESFKKFGHCDDGAVAEGFSEGVMTGLATRWEKFAELAALAKKDAVFSKFILRHVDETATPETLKAIAKNAKASCPKGHEAFCKQIDKAATAAMAP